MNSATAIAKVRRPLIDIREVARIIDVGTRQVHRLIEAKKIPKPMKVGNLLRWKPQEIDRWIANGCGEISEE